MENVDSDFQDEDDDESGLDCIEENLWLGNLIAATNWELIQSKNISHILTVDAFPLEKFNELPHVTLLHIPVTDLPTEDLISQFGKAYDFISNGVNHGVVLVHCYQGVSRSPAVILAYLMKKYRISLEKAYELVKHKRRIVQPNPGFMDQLKLYERMGFEIDDTNIQYKMFHLFIAGDRTKNNKKLPQNYYDVVKTDPALEVIEPDPRVYRCRKCRRVLAAEANIIPHFPNSRFSWRDVRYSDEFCDDDYCTRLFFVEPLEWMKNITCTLSGKLYCPNERCQAKLGTYCWNTGCLCPCGTKVTPGFYLIPAKVDKGYFVHNFHTRHSLRM